MSPSQSTAVEAEPSIAARSLNAVKSNYVGTAVRIGAQFISQIFIMRSLGPELVGTFGYALLLYGVLALIIDQGFGWSLIQGRFDDTKEISVVFSRIMLMSLASAVAVYFLSYPLAHLLGNELAGSVFRYSAPSYLLIGLFVVAQARLRADLRFGEIQSATTGAYLIAYPVVGVVMALTGFGVWSLVAAWYVQAILQVLIGFYYSPHSLRLANPFRSTKSGPLGRHVAGINLLNWSVDNASSVFVGSMGALALGNFNAASMLARTPTMHLVQTLQSIIFSTASAIREDREMIRRMYLGALATVSFIVIPAYAYAATHADFIISLLFGEKWMGAADVFSTLSIGMAALAVSTLSGPILTATGSQRAVFLSQSLALLLILAGLYGATHTSNHAGLFYVGLSITVAYVAGLFMQLVVLVKKNVITPIEFAQAVKGPFFIAMLMAAPVSLVADPGTHRTSFEIVALLLKCAAAILLIKHFPRFFLGNALLGALSKLGFGRRLLGALAL